MSVSCLNCPVIDSCFALKLDKGGRQRLDELLHRFVVRGRGRVIFNQGELAHGHILCGGSVKLTHVYRGGEEIMFDYLIAPSTLGKRDRLGPNIYPYSVVSTSQTTEVAHVNTERLLALLKDYPAALLDFVNHTRRQTEKVYNLLACMRLPVRDRLVSVLALILPMEDSPSVKVPFANIELAQLTQAAPETISRTLQRLRKEGVVMTDSKGTTAIRTSALRESLDKFLNHGSAQRARD
jgi:CRP-like cAMP-binding protein